MILSYITHLVHIKVDLVTLSILVIELIRLYVRDVETSKPEQNSKCCQIHVIFLCLTSFLLIERYLDCTLG